MPNKEVHHGDSPLPQTEQPRFKLLNNGPHSLSDAELIAIFLGSGYSGHSAVDMARDMLVEAQGLRPLLEQNRNALLKTKGLGEAKWVLLQAALELGRRYLEAEVRAKPVLCNPIRPRLTLKPGYAVSPMRCLPACSWITATVSSTMKSCLPGPLTAPASTRARWSNAVWN